MSNLKKIFFFNSNGFDLKCCYYLVEWIAAKYLEGRIFVMCLAKKLKSNIRIGSKCKWKDTYKILYGQNIEKRK